MEIANRGTDQGFRYVNPNNRTLTTGRKNTEIRDRDGFGWMRRLLNPVEDMVKALTTPIKLADHTDINRAANTLTIAAGTQIPVGDGYILTVTQRGVECRHGKNYDPYDTEAYKRAQGLADSLAVLLGNAGGTQQTTAFSREEYQKWTNDVSTVLSYMGIDSSRDFTLNGMKYSKNRNGFWESAREQSAKAAYERALANNRTYTYADERTRGQISYISNYYLENVSEQMRAAWQRALEETGVNPFPEGYGSTLSQLSMEQDFATGGDDDIFGTDAAGNIAAVQSIIDRIDHPLGDIPEKDRSFREDEKVFYTAVLKYLTAEEAKETVPASTAKQAADNSQPCTTYESANYRIEPDNESGCVTIYNKDGESLGTFFYSDIKCRQDGATGKQFLISEKGTMWYDVLVLDQELKEDLKHVMGVDSLETESLQGYSLKTHAGTGIQYILRDGEEGRGGRVLLQSEADRREYEALAETYFQKYPNLIESKEEAYIWASFEIRGMAMRTEQGIISLHSDGMSYNDNDNAKDYWSIRFQGDAWQKIFEWLDHSREYHRDMQKFSVWRGIFDDIGIKYERIWSETEKQQGYLNG